MRIIPFIISLGLCFMGVLIILNCIAVFDVVFDRHPTFKLCRTEGWQNFLHLASGGCTFFSGLYLMTKSFK